MPGSSPATGCPVEDHVGFLSDPVRRPRRRFGVRGRTTHWSWTSAWGRLTMIDLDTGRLAHTAKGSSATADIFDGFASFAVHDEDGKVNVGLSPHATKEGFCSDGCMRLGHQDAMSGVFTGLPALPFKATMDSVSFHDRARGVYYAQGSYALNEAARCDPDDTTQCLFSINSTSGQLLGSRKTSAFTAYRFADQQPIAADGTVLAWGFGFQDKCGKTLDSYAFARVELATAKSTLVACIDQAAAQVHKSPEMAAFSHDGATFAFATGDSIETGNQQLLVFNTTDGALLLNNGLEKLPQALGVSTIMPFFAIRGLAHMPPAATVVEDEEA